MLSNEQLKIYVKLVLTILRWKWQDGVTHRSYRIVNVLGDSHTRYFRFLQNHYPLKSTYLRVFNVTGATASGLSNPHSKTRAAMAFGVLLRYLNKRQSLLIQLGEVDCGFAIWIRAAKKGTRAEDELKRAFDNYMASVRMAMDLGFKKVFIATVSPPTIEDWNVWRGPIGHLRRQVAADIMGRSQLTRLFNQLLREGAETVGYTFLDVETLFTDPETSLVRPELFSDRPGDLHLNNHEAAKIFRKALVAANFV